MIATEFNSATQAFRRGFTLLEVIVVLGVSSLLLTMLTMVSTQFVESAHRGIIGASQDAQARAFFGFFETQLSLRHPQTSFFAPDSSSFDSVGWVHSIPQTGKDGSGALGISLIRLEMPKTQTSDGPSLLLKTCSPPLTLQWLKSSKMSFVSELYSEADEPQELLLKHVAHFRVEFLTRDTVTGDWEVFDRSSEFRPSALRVMLGLIDPRDLGRLTTAAEWQQWADPNQPLYARLRHYERVFLIGP